MSAPESTKAGHYYVIPSTPKCRSDSFGLFPLEKISNGYDTLENSNIIKVKNQFSESEPNSPYLPITLVNDCGSEVTHTAFDHPIQAQLNNTPHCCRSSVYIPESVPINRPKQSSIWNKLNSKYCKGTIILVLVLVLVSVLAVLLLDFVMRLQKLRGVQVYSQHEMEGILSAKSQPNVEYFRTGEKPVIVFCNANPFRGSTVFLLQNGTRIYDELTQDGNIPKHLLDAIKMTPRKFIFETGHRVEEIIKKWFPFHLKKEISLLLDAQEYDYLVPNNGFVGFRSWIYSSLKEASDVMAPLATETGLQTGIVSTQQTENGSIVEQISNVMLSDFDDGQMFLGSQFQSNIRISFAVSRSGS
ncbi:acid-sensing (proton-gated) ion channel [Cichlidogyrus casuarinus]|uniref:Acid-sensing (Proton-gated) ion channel n=1 Tax=Cichlidogyrus casuarinus TaxID=1844966 RepID=A0ABD2PTA8_9PLAT